MYRASGEAASKSSARKTAAFNQGICRNYMIESVDEASSLTDHSSGGGTLCLLHHEWKSELSESDCRIVPATGCALLLQPAAAKAAASSDPIAINECRIAAPRRAEQLPRRLRWLRG
jgi:hypothetical protein